MKYAIIAAVAAVAVAAPAEWDPVKPTTTPEWEPVKPTTSVWEPIKVTTTEKWEPVKITTTPVWEPVKVTTKCSTVSTYTTKECGDDEKDWNNCKVVTKYTTLYPEKCEATTTKYDWVPVPTPAKCSTTSVYVTKECNIKKGDDWNKWEDCKEVTKTSTVYPTVCPTPVKVTETWAPVKATETPVKGAETWAAVSSKVPAATSSWSPVATFKGAADKQTFGMGALAIAAVAALL